MQIPDKVKKILKTLNDKGYEAYVVGGAVRDYIMGEEPHDWDITTNAKPDEIKEIFDRTILTGIKHGTVVVMDGTEGFEVTTYRTDGKYTDGRHPDEVQFSSKLEEDLKRRDFTMNAIAMDVDGNIIDPFDGVSDIRNKVIWCVGHPADRFSEDSLRMLRAVRFESQLGFSLPKREKLYIAEQADSLKRVSAERIRDELTKLILSKDPSRGLIDAYECGITAVVLPEFDRMLECPQNSPYHYTDVGRHSLKVLENVSPDPVLRWAALLHDVGKPDTKTWDEEKGYEHFIGHAERSAEIANEVLLRLKFSNADRHMIRELVRVHDYKDRKPTRLRTFAAEHGREFIDKFRELSIADAGAHSKWCRDKLVALREDLFGRFDELFKEGSVIQKKDLKINGRDLLAAGFKDTEIGQFLEEAYKDCLANPEHNDHEFLMRTAQRRLLRHGKGACDMKYNSRLEHRKAGTPLAKVGPVAQSTLMSWKNDGVINDILAYDDKHIRYFVEDKYGGSLFERALYYPEKDDIRRIRKSVICDDRAAELINPEAVADFVYNCIDVNAVSAVEHIALIYDDAELDSDGNVTDYKISPGREKLCIEAGNGDEYAYEVGMEQLGIVWVERSTVILNVREIEDVCREEAEGDAEYFGIDAEVAFADLFKDCVVQTLCHEFRHAVYELNDVAAATGINNEGPYPESGNNEEAIEEYGNDAAEYLSHDLDSLKYIRNMFYRDKIIETYRAPKPLEAEEEVER